MHLVEISIVRPTKIIKDTRKAGMTMTWFSTRCIFGFMPNLHTKSWMVSSIHISNLNFEQDIIHNSFVLPPCRNPDSIVSRFDGDNITKSKESPGKLLALNMVKLGLLSTLSLKWCPERDPIAFGKSPFCSPEHTTLSPS